MTRPQWTKSLRVRITAWSALVTAVILIVAGVSMVAVQGRELVGATDVILEEAMLDLETSIRAPDVAPGRGASRDPERGEGVRDLRASIVSYSNTTKRTVQVLDLDGAIVSGARNFDDDVLVDIDDLRFIDDGSSEVLRRTRPFSVSADDDTRYRVIVGTNAREGRGPYLVIAEPLRDVERAIALQALVLVVTIPALIALLAVLIWVVTGRALKPVVAIQREVATISGDDLHRRVPVPETSLEIEQLATTMNGMLDRLDESAERQRRFVDDASHELRSPIAGVRGLLEVNLAHPVVADWDESGREMLGETIRMQHLVDDLMTLARGTSSKSRRAAELLDLDDIMLAEGARLRRETELAVDLTEVSAAQVVGDVGELTRVVRNLVDNAARHARSTISLSLTERDDDDHRGLVELVVQDDGPGIAPEMADRIFERFTRLDEARARDEGGSGLGLAIVKAIVERHGGSIGLDKTHDGGARFVVGLPSESVA